MLAKSVVIALLGLVSQTSFATKFILKSNHCKVYSEKNQKEWVVLSWTGECINGYINGHGAVKRYINRKLTYIYIGEFKDGMFGGQGTMIWDDGDKYVGEWRDGLFHGQGTYTWADGRQYSGGWKNDERHGQGIETYADGGKYIGEWRDNERNGQGTYTWANGDEYIGEFKDGVFHGQGTRTYATGERYVGKWEDGMAMDVEETSGIAQRE